MTEREFMRLMAVLTGAYPGFTITEHTEAVYREMLKDLPYSAVMAAAREHIATSSRFPTIAELRATVAERAAGMPQPEAAWSEVEERIRAGFDGPREWSHPAIKQVVNEIGWWELCHGDDLEANHRRFVRRYRELRDETIRALQTGRIPLPDRASREPDARALPAPEAADRIAMLRRRNQELLHAIRR